MRCTHLREELAAQDARVAPQLLASAKLIQHLFLSARPLLAPAGMLREQAAHLNVTLLRQPGERDGEWRPQQPAGEAPLHEPHGRHAARGLAEVGVSQRAEEQTEALAVVGQGREEERRGLSPNLSLHV